MTNITLNTEICSHRSCLEAFALKFTNDVENANDLVQDTIIKAIRYHSLYKEGTNLKGWLYTIMKNTFINDYRKNVRRNTVVEISEDLSSYQLHNSASNNLGENKFMMDDIQKALSKVQPEYSIPFLRYFEGYKYHEIAEEMNIPLGTVKTRIHVARQVLKSHLKMYSKDFRKTA
ncbi:sigma-70 family RNA polymerase sigma factor [Pedobacter metabolipauper]|uniref:RNA polymerase ECF family sigma subunit n=1 Tax=Pedobacter metabolipauper TaxID=425513 RepID=A0A4V3D1H1_9SPHI|nr:sigma-70 family RNA polymerase sigma factor [Pedobacter metabolipauper]TDQ11173.1 RNA polymerase ECF family sigma subunit [Pedobacter metabolipauper]